MAHQSLGKGGAASLPLDVGMTASPPSEAEHCHERAGLIEPLAPDPDAGAGDDRDILLAADAVGHRRSRDRSAEVEAVHLLEGFSVIRSELSGHVSGEQQAA